MRSGSSTYMQSPKTAENVLPESFTSVPFCRALASWTYAMFWHTVKSALLVVLPAPLVAFENVMSSSEVPGASDSGRWG